MSIIIKGAMMHNSLRLARSALHILFAIFCSAAYAGNNAAPLGQEIGVATSKQVRDQIGNQTQLADGGINKFSGGRMLKGDGSGLGVEGLQDVLFIFDASDKLSGVVMTMGKDRFKDTLDALSKKYKLVGKQVPFVGNSYAKFKQGSSVVELDAPHMSFSLELRYLSDELLAVFNNKSSVEAAEKKRNQASKL
jgi:hypothetical protein